MANEATLMIETELPIPFTVADATGIEKGAVLKMTDPMTAIINSAINDIPAGIGAEEKIASDGRTKHAVYRGGIFKSLISGAVTVGDSLAISATVNALYKADASTQPNWIIGTALETGANAETILWELHPGRGGMQVS